MESGSLFGIKWELDYNFRFSKGGNGNEVMGAVVQLVEYRTRNREVAGLTHTRSTASNLEQVPNLLCAQAQRDGK